MPAPSHEKWNAVRALYERHGIAVELISPCCGLREETISKRAKRQGWKANNAADWQTQRSLVQIDRLRGAFDTQLDELQRRQADQPFDEKNARALATLAKALETIMDLPGGDGPANEVGQHDNGGVAGDALAIDTELTRLIEGIGGEEEDS